MTRGKRSGVFNTEEEHILGRWRTPLAGSAVSAMGANIFKKIHLYYSIPR